MASPLMFDLHDIDPKGIAVTAEEVGRLNPQCGAMRQLDYLIWMSPDSTRGLGVKHVKPDEFWVSGHIPGRPLLPGVLMIEAGAQLCSILYKKKTGNYAFLGFTHCNDVTFRSQVVPGDTLFLLARELKFGTRRFESEVQAVVGDRLVLEARISGMVI